MNLLTTNDKQIVINAQLFSGVPASIIEEALVGSQVKVLSPGQVLLCPDSINRYIYLVLSGNLEVHVGESGPNPLADIGIGECVGEMSVLDSLNPSARVVASEPTRILELHQTKVWRCIDATEGMARNLLYILSDRLRVNTTALTESRRREFTFERFANIDALTELHNRRGLDHGLQRLLDVEPDQAAPLSLILLDIDFFKHYNDSHGHPAGDSALKQVAKVIATSLRPTDFAARYGGEEFAVVLPNTDLDQGVQTAERLCAAIRDAKLSDINNDPLPSITISAGVAEYQHGQDKEQLMATADAALYRAKQGGRDRVMV